MELFKRSLYCGHINDSLLGKEVFLAGWIRTRRDHGGLIFIDLYDRTGLMQLVFNPDINKEAHELAHTLRSEFVISVRGKVVNRSPEAINEKLPTGKFELQVENLSIVNKCDVLPFQLDEADNVDEELRLRYRYLDLRRERMHQIFKLRHDIVFAVRKYLNDQDFCEIETPILSKSTPEGARDFLVPSRLCPGTFYALPQSPQIYKQLLMVAGFDKYFQIARCFRDEDLRANRQLEFTQLDIEMSFVQESDVQNATEGIMSAIWKKVFDKELALPFPRMTFKEAFARFGNDKPDTRFGLEINDVTSLFEETELGFLKSVIEKGGKVGALCVEKKPFSRSKLDSLVETAKQKLGAKGLLYIRFNEEGKPDSPVSKFLPDDFFRQARAIFPNISTKDTLFLVSDEYKEAWNILGKLRIMLGKSLDLINNEIFNFLWVTNFPLFEWSEDDNRWYAMHHPFTQPQKNWESLPLQDIPARAYDLVCNGEELGGGSIRIHDFETQKKIFEILGISLEKAKEKFSCLLEAQRLGYPPEGGIALGLDRLIMLIAGTDSIRDVIAFPKTQTGACLMMQTPSEVDPSQLKELNLKTTIPK